MEYGDTLSSWTDITKALDRSLCPCTDSPATVSRLFSPLTCGWNVFVYYDSERRLATLGDLNDLRIQRGPLDSK
jgi:hypothetical protein